jgi:hypothetical protein
MDSNTAIEAQATADLGRCWRVVVDAALVCLIELVGCVVPGTRAASASAGTTIHMRSVINRDYLDESLAFVNSVDHPVRTASRTPEALELETERFAHPVRRIRDVVNRL